MGKNGHVHFSDETRQAALFETMILAAGSDGDVSRVEVEEIYRRVFERPEFHGIHASDLRQAISHAAQKVAQQFRILFVLDHPRGEKRWLGTRRRFRMLIRNWKRYLRYRCPDRFHDARFGRADMRFERRAVRYRHV